MMKKMLVMLSLLVVILFLVGCTKPGEGKAVAGEAIKISPPTPKTTTAGPSVSTVPAGLNHCVQYVAEKTPYEGSVCETYAKEKGAIGLDPALKEKFYCSHLYKGYIILERKTAPLNNPNTLTIGSIDSKTKLLKTAEFNKNCNPVKDVVKARNCIDTQYIETATYKIFIEPKDTKCLTVNEYCVDKIDNDADGKIDCADNECASASVCKVADVVTGPVSILSCVDSDKKSTPSESTFIKGMVDLSYTNGTTKSFVDYCTNSTALIEYFCGSYNNKDSSPSSCSGWGSGYTCSDGKCVAPTSGY